MRIIGGRWGGYGIRPPKNLPVRPTTDFAKEGLFNILANTVDFEGLRVLDLFSGTGNISLEFASRGGQVTAVDAHARCVSFLRSESEKLKLEITTVRADVFAFLQGNSATFDLVFADPPYDLGAFERLHALIDPGKRLTAGGVAIIEHGAATKLDGLPLFTRSRRYGNVNFSFFRQAGAQE